MYIYLYIHRRDRIGSSYYLLTPPPPMFCELCGQKNLNFSAIYRIYILISYYVQGLQYMPPRVLALWGQNAAGANINNVNSNTDTERSVSNLKVLIQKLYTITYFTSLKYVLDCCLCFELVT